MSKRSFSRNCSIANWPSIVVRIWADGQIAESAARDLAVILHHEIDLLRMIMFALDLHCGSRLGVVEIGE